MTKQTDNPMAPLQGGKFREVDVADKEQVNSFKKKI